MEFYMENKTKNIIIVIEAVIIVVLVAFMILENNKTNTETGNSNGNTQGTENIIEDAEKAEYIKTYNIIEKLDISDERGNYDFYAIRQFQDNDNPVLIKVEKKYNLEEYVKEHEKLIKNLESKIKDNFDVKVMKTSDYENKFNNTINIKTFYYTFNKSKNITIFFFNNHRIHLIKHLYI